MRKGGLEPQDRCPLDLRQHRALERQRVGGLLAFERASQLDAVTAEPGRGPDLFRISA
jgi:hypothetical protein